MSFHVNHITKFFAFLSIFIILYSKILMPPLLAQPVAAEPPATEHRAEIDDWLRCDGLAPPLNAASVGRLFKNLGLIVATAGLAGGAVLPESRGRGQAAIIACSSVLNDPRLSGLWPRHVNILFSRALAQYEMGRFLEARDDAQAAVALIPPPAPSDVSKSVLFSLEHGGIYWSTRFLFALCDHQQAHSETTANAILALADERRFSLVVQNLAMQAIQTQGEYSKQEIELSRRRASMQPLANYSLAEMAMEQSNAELAHAAFLELASLGGVSEAPARAGLATIAALHGDLQLAELEATKAQALTAKLKAGQGLFKNITAEDKASAAEAEAILVLFRAVLQIQKKLPEQAITELNSDVKPPESQLTYLVIRFIQASEIKDTLPSASMWTTDVEAMRRYIRERRIRSSASRSDPAGQQRAYGRDNILQALPLVEPADNHQLYWNKRGVFRFSGYYREKTEENPSISFTSSVGLRHSAEEVLYLRAAKHAEKKGCKLMRVSARSDIVTMMGMTEIPMNLDIQLDYRLLGCDNNSLPPDAVKNHMNIEVGSILTALSDAYGASAPPKAEKK
jgi:hypothetical protein